MNVLIIGYPDSGKSRLAEDMVMEMSAPGERFYLATMIPYGEEGQARVDKHRKMRDGKGFETIEAPFDAAETARKAGIGEKSTVLLECMSNLVANELFERHTDSEKVIEKVVSDMSLLAEGIRDLVIVSNHFEISEGFDEETVLYAKTLDTVNERLCETADRVIRL
jgi:adenosylcobinamide kinase/adenosylcobinamide-phosphate guanylyltransferase